MSYFGKMKTHFLFPKYPGRRPASMDAIDSFMVQSSRPDWEGQQLTSWVCKFRRSWEMRHSCGFSGTDESRNKLRSTILAAYHRLPLSPTTTRPRQLLPKAEQCQKGTTCGRGGSRQTPQVSHRWRQGEHGASTERQCLEHVAVSSVLEASS